MAFDFNFDDCLRTLNQIEKRVAASIEKEVLEEGAKVILKAEKKYVPVGDTGKLKKSLDIGSIRVKKGAKTIQIGIVNDSKREVVYGYYQHYGTRRMIGKFWIDKAWLNSKDEAKEVMKIKLVKAITKGF